MGLLRRHLALALFGAVIALCGRQTIVFTMPGIAFWLWFGHGWRDRPRQLRLAAIGALTIAVGLTAVAITLVAKRFSIPFGATPYLLGGLVTLLEGKRALAAAFGEHVLRVLIPLSFALTTLVVAAMAVRRKGCRLPPELWAVLLMSGLIALQPVLIEPVTASRNETRLSAQGMVALVAALGFVFRELQRAGLPIARRPLWIALWFLAALGSSLHHMCSTIGPASAASYALTVAIASLSGAFALHQGLTPAAD